VAVLTDRGVARSWLMRIVARSTPELFPGSQFAPAGGQRGRMSVHRHALGGGRENLDIFGKVGAGTKVFRPPARLRDAQFARQMALFANRIAAARGKLPGVNKRVDKGIDKVRVIRLCMIRRFAVT